MSCDSLTHKLARTPGRPRPPCIYITDLTCTDSCRDVHVQPSRAFVSALARGTRIREHAITNRDWEQKWRWASPKRAMRDLSAKYIQVAECEMRAARDYRSGAVAGKYCFKERYLSSSRKLFINSWGLKRNGQEHWQMSAEKNPISDTNKHEKRQYIIPRPSMNKGNRGLVERQRHTARLHLYTGRVPPTSPAFHETQI
ncbi:hypothetical protein J6590_036441 [Homalodisca vitripennis]|nr:hypothetical protein J6590_036441 [Homalodisca vitripennis]